MIVRPAPLCGSSSRILSLRLSPYILGNASSSMNRLMKVDLPVLTGPTTPTYMSPSQRPAISLYNDH
jgi:hypothetical protein